MLIMLRSQINVYILNHIVSYVTEKKIFVVVVSRNNTMSDWFKRYTDYNEDFGFCNAILTNWKKRQITL